MNDLSTRLGVLSALYILLPLACAHHAPIESISAVRPPATRTHLHVHALSNHNGGEFPASIGFQMDQAEDMAGPDFIWWTEHEEIFQQLSCLRRMSFGFEGLVWRDARSLRLPVNSSKKIFTGWTVEQSEGARVEVVDGSLQATLPRGAWIRLHPVGAKGLIRSIHYALPVMLHPQLELYGKARGPLAVESHHMLSFDGAARGVIGAVPESQSYAVRRTDWSAGPLILAATPAEQTEHGSRSWRDWSLLFEATGDSATLFLDSVLTKTAHCDAAETWELYTTLMNDLRALRGEKSTIGAEYRMRDREWHVCAFLGEDLDAEFLQQDHRNRYPEWRQEVRNRGGLVSLSHVLGTVHRDTPAGEVERKSMRDRAFTTLMAGEDPCYGADLFEVGYPMRGDGTLDDYLLMWDAMAASGKPMVGIGVTDVHGKLWATDTQPRGWATWIYAGEDPVALLGALSRGEAYSGEMGSWDGDLWLEADGAGMGGHSLPRGGAVARRIRLSVAPGLPVPDLVRSIADDQRFAAQAGSSMELVVFRIGQTLVSPDDLVYIEKNRAIAANVWFDLALPDSTVVRAVVRNQAGIIVAATNPVYIGI